MPITNARIFDYSFGEQQAPPLLTMIYAHHRRPGSYRIAVNAIGVALSRGKLCTHATNVTTHTPRAENSKFYY